MGGLTLAQGKFKKQYSFNQLLVSLDFFPPYEFYSLFPMLVHAWLTYCFPLLDAVIKNFAFPQSLGDLLDGS